MNLSSNTISDEQIRHRSSNFLIPGAFPVSLLRNALIPVSIKAFFQLAFFFPHEFNYDYDTNFVMSFVVKILAAPSCDFHGVAAVAHPAIADLK